MSALKRIRNRLYWIHQVALQLGVTVTDKFKIYLGGLWFLITDSGKSNLKFQANIQHFGQQQSFLFQDLGDIGLFYEVFISDPYDLDDPKRVKTIFDIGANIGVATLYFKMRFPNAEIFCFEPDPQNFARLQEFTKQWDNVYAFKVALWSEDTTLTFYSDPHRGSSSSTHKIRERQKSMSVAAKSLHSILKSENISHIDILKFDIEGAEEEMFSTFHDFGCITLLLGEVHGDLCNADSVLNSIKDNFEKVSVTPFNNGNRFYLKAY